MSLQPNTESALRPRGAENPAIHLYRVLLEEHEALGGSSAGLPADFEKKANSEKLADVLQLLSQQSRTALCFSGGGIRSATFNLGVIQGLAEAGILHTLDFLSTVSGGGYIGSWLSAWIHHGNGNMNSVMAALAATGRRERQPKQSAPLVDKLQSEPAPIVHLREYSNYLSPRSGFLSADTWAMAGAYIRNLFLNWLVLLPMLAAVLAIPRVLSSLYALEPGPFWEWGPALLLPGTLLLIAAIAYMGDSLPLTNMKGSQGCRVIRFLWCCLLPLILSGILLTVFCCYAIKAFPQSIPKLPMRQLLSLFAAYGALVHFMAALCLSKFRRRNCFKFLIFALCGLGSGALGGLVLGGGAALVFRHTIDPGAYACFAIPFFFGAFLVGMFFYIGLVGKGTSDEDREWWARSSGWVLIVTTSWLLVSLLIVYGPVWLGRAMGETSVAGGLAGLAAALLGRSGSTPATADKSAENSEKDGIWNRVLDKAPMVGAPVFLAVLVIVISAMTTKLLMAFPSGPAIPVEMRSAQRPQRNLTYLLEDQAASDPSVGPAKSEQGVRLALVAKNSEEKNPTFLTHWHTLVLANTKWQLSLGGMAGLAALGVLAGFIVNANVFSMHAMYRDRLIRAYLGASRRHRKPNFFTGFDPEDNIPMWELWTKEAAAKRNFKLFPIINCTLNLVHGKNLAWQDRKAESFIVSPLHCGSLFIRDNPESNPAGGSMRKSAEGRGYRRTNPVSATGEDDAIASKLRYGGSRGISLGTAVTISGAAASPNWGYHSSPVVTLLMTFFNVRLGCWLGNPGPAGNDTFKRWYPKWAPRPIIEEALGLTDDEHPYIYLSDGGHFENLGVYEMILRRCRLIIACDAGEDHAFTFDDLGNLVRKVRIDFGIPIDFASDSALFSLDPETNRPTDGKTRFALARIRYSAVDERAEDGVLIYVKPVVYGGVEPRDVVQYWRSNSSFPHESTADQFFSESQFESYRALGLCSISEVLREIGIKESAPGAGHSELIDLVKAKLAQPAGDRGG